MSPMNRARIQTVLIVVFFMPIVAYFINRKSFSFRETLGVSPWLILGMVSSVAIGLAIYGYTKRKVE